MLRYLFCLLFIGLACLVKSQPLPALIPYTDGKLWGYCDSTGIVKIPPQWDEANFFIDDKAIVKVNRLESRNNWELGLTILLKG